MYCSRWRDTPSKRAAARTFPSDLLIASFTMVWRTFPSISSIERCPTVSDTMSLDVQLPAPDAFNYWTGDIQMFLSCGETLWNSPVGTTVPLTNRFDGEYNTVYFEVTPEQQAAMVAPGEACQFHVALNVTPGGDFVLDNLGFVYPQ